MKMDKLMGQGELIPTDTVLNLINEKMISSLNFTNGFLLDGFPRKKSQAKLFNNKIRAPDVVIYLKADDRVLKERVLGRAVTSGRNDDNEKIIDSRIKLFSRKNNSILKYFGEALCTIDAERDMKTIFNEVSVVVDKYVEASQIDRTALLGYDE